MGIEIIYILVIILLLFAAFDIVVGVANDAVNFLNSAIGSSVQNKIDLSDYVLSHHRDKV